MTTVNRHGNNMHPDLPPCVCCGVWAWETGDVHMGHGMQAFFSCLTPDCDGRAIVVFYGLPIAVLFEAPLIDGYFMVPEAANAWINSAKKAIRGGDLMACIHAGQKPPANMPLPPVPDLDPAVFLTGRHTWTRAEPGAIVDLAGLFAERVASAKAAEVAA